MDGEQSSTFTAEEQRATTVSRRYSYAKLLRAIGQTLDAQNLASIELAYHSGACFIRTVAYRAQRADWSIKGLFYELLSSLGWLKDKQVGQCVIDENRYHASDVERLANLASAKRVNDRAVPDPFTFGERLRTVGSLIDADPNRELVTLSASKHDGELSFSYRSESGELRKNRLAAEQHYKIWKSCFLERKIRDDDNPVHGL